MYENVIKSLIIIYKETKKVKKVGKNLKKIQKSSAQPF